MSSIPGQHKTDLFTVNVRIKDSY
ncbi:hypothetical protein SAMN02910384_03027 [Pseudobutyrivibrio sp. ACV-2]|nr:hypothetical protein SAMN02910384_02722 [Pseudobutyrivibrio sp. ACV-2]SEB00136.1 hypothetical protein SAMN02910384_03027 [Pseudobutyrivibrio sp. ACV-2]